MKINMGSADRTTRLVVAVLLVALVLTEVFSGILAIAAMVLAGVFALTSLVGVCPIYKLFRCTTLGGKKTST